MREPKPKLARGSLSWVLANKGEVLPDPPTPASINDKWSTLYDTHYDVFEPWTMGACRLNRPEQATKGNKVMDNTPTDEEINARFAAAETRTHELEELVLNEVPGEIIDKFLIGKNKELFGTLLIAPGMDLDEGLYCAQSSAEADKYADVDPAELILVRSYVGHPTCDTAYAAGANWRGAGLPIPAGVPVIMLRRHSPTQEQLLPREGHYIEVPATWQEVVGWAQALVAMGAVNGEVGG